VTRFGRSILSHGLPLTLVLLGLIAAGTVYWGFSQDGFEFGSNLLAEVAGIALSVLIAILAVDALVERRRRQRWAAVRQATLNSIHTHIIDIVADCLMSSPIVVLMSWQEEGTYWDRIGPASGPPTTETAEAIAHLSTFIRSNEAVFQEIEEKRGRYADLDQERREAADRWKARDWMSRVLYDDVREEVYTLRDVLAPRVLDLSNDPHLTELMLDVEVADRYWRHAIWALENGWDYRSFHAWRAVAALLKACSSVVSHLSKA
jgi:hypothetical protein